jgi:hypothetical protein
MNDMAESKPPTTPELPQEVAQEATPAAPQEITEDRYWHKNGWSAKVIKNEEDDGWAVEVTRDGDPEPLLTSPWTMGRDKKNPKPLDLPSFIIMVKTASEVLRRTMQQRDRMLHKSLSVAVEGSWYRIKLDIVPDEDEPHAFLSALDDAGTELARYRVAANYKLAQATSERWVKNGFPEP